MVLYVNVTALSKHAFAFSPVFQKDLKNRQKRVFGGGYALTLCALLQKRSIRLSVITWHATPILLYYTHLKSTKANKVFQKEKLYKHTTSSTQASATAFALFSSFPRLSLLFLLHTKHKVVYNAFFFPVSVSLLLFWLPGLNILLPMSLE